MNKIEKIQLAKSRKVKIGIDGGESTGVAIREGDGILILHTMDFWAVYEFIIDTYTTERVAIYIEDPEQNKPVFHPNQGPKQRLKIAQNVGGVKRESTLLIRGLEKKGYLVIPVRPTKKKWSHALFCRMTGWPENESTNEHQRDAARLILKR